MSSKNLRATADDKLTVGKMADYILDRKHSGKRSFFFSHVFVVSYPGLLKLGIVW